MKRQDAIAAYWGLCELLDFNIGKVIKALTMSGLDADVIYTSDHGDNVGARGLWGKSNMYRESVNVPLIARMRDVKPGRCDTPVSLLDVSESIPRWFGLDWQGERPGQPLQDIAAKTDDLEREIFSQYHAAGAVSGAYMLCAGRWKLIEYVGYEPELFNMTDDPEETKNLAAQKPLVVKKMRKKLAKYVDVDAANQQAFADQGCLD